MKKNNSKVYALIALVIAVFALSVGFATFSQTLFISDASAEINASNEFTSNVKFVANSLDCTDTNGKAVVDSTGVLDSENTIWKDLSIILKEPGDSVNCTVEVYNASSYEAFLKEISFASTLNCAAKQGSGVNSASASNVEAVCGANGIIATASVGSNSATTTKVAVSNNTNIASNNTLASEGTDEVTFTILYPSDAQSADGDITITIPQISLLYKTANE